MVRIIVVIILVMMVVLLFGLFGGVLICVIKSDELSCIIIEMI